jgi:hydroxymethylbilane synthase
MRHRRIVIGTRGSTLARAQAAIIADRLQRRQPGIAIEIKVVVTSGDRDQKSHLSAIGGKGIFIRELEQALLDGSVDMAVHSFKDVTSQLAPGLALTAFLRPESVCDVMVTHENVPFHLLPDNARIGTGSMRRKALLLRLRPDLQITEIRGNIDTRLAKVMRKEYDGIMLSEAGLIRLNLENRITERFDPSTFYPAPGQGVITIETRADDDEIKKIAASAGDDDQLVVSTAELTLLTAIGFDCRTPLGVYTTIKNAEMVMRGFYIDTDNGIFRECSAHGTSADPSNLGSVMAAQLIDNNGTR